jgi:hypothetical protein
MGAGGLTELPTCPGVCVCPCSATVVPLQRHCGSAVLRCSVSGALGRLRVWPLDDHLQPHIPLFGTVDPAPVCCCCPRRLRACVFACVCVCVVVWPCVVWRVLRSA